LLGTYNLFYILIQGGHSLFSKKFEKLYKGINLSDSLALDQHKGVGVSIFSAVILTNNKPKALERSNGKLELIKL